PILTNNEVGFGSSAELNVYLKNKRNYFVVSDLFVSASTGVLSDRNFDVVVLGPNAEVMRKFSFIVPSNLSTDYDYTYFITAFGPGFDERVNLSVKPDAAVIQREGLRINSAGVSVLDESSVVSVELQNYGTEKLSNILVTVSRGDEKSSKLVTLDSGVTVTQEFAMEAVNESDYFTVRVSYGDVFLSKTVSVVNQPKEEAVQPLPGVSKVFIAGFIIITSIALALLAYPRKAKKSKAKRVKDDDFKKHMKKRKITRSIEFLEEEEKQEHDVSEMEKPKHRRK
ncbi:hypothetical protein H0N95_00345, partial [Candidatus Micrarchaeota archaeon]|nr:hypothetical protein [Candidatus Micrarchaeota archaeon]